MKKSSRRNTAIIILSVIGCLLAIFLIVEASRELGRTNVEKPADKPGRTTSHIADQSDSYTIRGGLHASPSASKAAPSASSGTFGSGSQIRSSSTGNEEEWINYHFSFRGDGTCVITIDDVISYGTWFMDSGVIIYEVDGEIYTGIDDGHAFITYYDGMELILPRS